VARRLLDGEHEEHVQRRALLGVVLGEQEKPLAAVVGRADAGQREHCLAVLGEMAPLLGAILLRDIHDAEQAWHERAQLHAAERKITRAGLDLHDGPIQELAALAADVRLLAKQLDAVLADSAQREVMHGRIEDLDAQLLALDRSLREISSEVRAGQTAPRQQFRATLEETIRKFAERAGIRTELTLSGPVGTLSDSQQIALLNIVAESLSNVRRHAHAHAVTVVVRASAQGSEATIRDDGRGFDPGAKSLRGSHHGHTGLLAIAERARLLGGSCAIDSRPGGPTCVRVVLPRWTPAAAAREEERRGHALAAARGSAARGSNGASSFSTA
jgi:signal transduction histidine kinase